MLGNFTYHNPTKLYFGEDALNGLAEELKMTGPTVMLTYGGGSIKRNGIYDSVIGLLKKAGKTIVEDAGVMSNPTLEKLHEGIQIARNQKVDFILAVGGGSVADYSKAVAASAHFDGDYWNTFFVQQQNPPKEQKILPVGCVLTMAGTGSEMNAGSVITDAEHTAKIGHVFDDRLIPRFAILNPRFTMTVPNEQMRAGIFDIFSHILEQYFSGTDDNTSDYIAEGLLKSLIVASRKAVADPQDYEARSNIMWTATWALNTLIGCGKRQDWMVHMFGHSIGAYTHAPHGFALSAVSLPYYKHTLPFAVSRFKRFAEEVWGICPSGKTDHQVAEEGLAAMEAWMKEIGLPLTISELGATNEMLEGIAKGTIILDSGYRKLTFKEVVDILKESM